MLRKTTNAKVFALTFSFVLIHLNAFFYSSVIVTTPLFPLFLNCKSSMRIVRPPLHLMMLVLVLIFYFVYLSLAPFTIKGRTRVWLAIGEK